MTANFSSATFHPPLMLCNGHTMTIFASLYRRSFELPPSEIRKFYPDPHTTIITRCHWQKDRQTAPTILLVHGLEGDANRHYMLGAAEKAWEAKFNVIRMNVRNCGGTEHLTPTLYHSGFTSDLKFIVQELIGQDRLSAIFLVGFSMGGNQILKLAGEWGDAIPKEVLGIVAISPPVNLELCSRSIKEKRNIIYEQRFLRSLKKRMILKSKIYPGICDLEALAKVNSLWDFDEVVTAPVFGFEDARDYYRQASSLSFLPKIVVSTLIIQAQDDPFIPFTAFATLHKYRSITLCAPKHGGHVGFWQRSQTSSNHYWAEQQAIEFCKHIYF